MTRERLNAESLAFMKEAAHRGLPIPSSFIDGLAAEVTACWEERERLTAALAALVESCEWNAPRDRRANPDAVEAGRAALDALREPQHSTACSMNAAVRLGADCICGALREPQEDAR